MLSKIFAVMVFISFLFGFFTGNIDNVCSSVLTGAAEAVKLSFSMLGIMCLWSGIVRVLSCAGATEIIARLIMPVVKIIYKKSYREGKDLSELCLNVTMNLLGMGNAAMPSGLNTIKTLSCEKDRSGNLKYTANDDAIMFAVLNTTPLQIMPTSLIALRKMHMSENPYEIIVPIWICSVLTTIFAVFTCRVFSYFWKGKCKE